MQFELRGALMNDFSPERKSWLSYQLFFLVGKGARHYFLDLMARQHEQRLRLWVKGQKIKILIVLEFFFSIG